MLLGACAMLSNIAFLLNSVMLFPTLTPSLDAHLESLLVLGVEWAGMSPDFSGPELPTARAGRATF